MPAPERRPILLIEQEPLVPAGHIADWLDRRALTYEQVTASANDHLPDPDGYSAVIALGSQHAAYDDSLPWVPREIETIRTAVAAEIPVLGVCFGGQALARALGASVTKAPRPEIGWVELTTRRSDLVETGPWFAWHGDVFTLPAHAELLAYTAHSVQAFASGPHLGLQFHPEVTPEIVDSWLAASRQMNMEPPDAQPISQATRTLAPAARDRAFRLFDAWFDAAALKTQAPRGEVARTATSMEPT